MKLLDEDEDQDQGEGEGQGEDEDEEYPAGVAPEIPCFGIQHMRCNNHSVGRRA